jgi:hypothetical protein
MALLHPLFTALGLARGAEPPRAAPWALLLGISCLLLAL